jgi:hypothetical protein
LENSNFRVTVQAPCGAGAHFFPDIRDTPVKTGVQKVLIFLDSGSPPESRKIKIA